MLNRSDRTHQSPVDRSQLSGLSCPLWAVRTRKYPSCCHPQCAVFRSAQLYFGRQQRPAL
jgi:hypothetical protein